MRHHALQMFFALLLSACGDGDDTGPCGPEPDSQCVSECANGECGELHTWDCNESTGQWMPREEINECGWPPSDGGTPDAAPADATVDADPCAHPPGSGMFTLQWVVQQSGAPATCAAVGAEYVELHALQECTGRALGGLFDCGDLAGTTSALELSQYEVRVFLLDGDFAALGESVPRTAAIATDGQTVDLGQYVFDFP